MKSDIQPASGSCQARGYLKAQGHQSRASIITTAIVVAHREHGAAVGIQDLVQLGLDRQMRGDATGKILAPRCAHQRCGAQYLGARDTLGEFLDIVGGRVQHQFLRCADLNDRAVFHDRDAVGETNRFLEIVGDEHDGLVQNFLQAHEFVLHLAPDQWIQRRKGFVEKPDIRLRGERARDADALLLAAGQFPRVVLFAAVETDQFDDFERALFARRLADALDFERQRDIAEHGAVRQQGEVLEHHAHLVAAQVDQLLFADLHQVERFEADFAVARLDQARHAAQ